MNKKLIFLVSLLIITSSGFAQEWFTSFDIARRMALANNKMLLVIWEDSARGPYPVLVNEGRKMTVVQDLKTNEILNEAIWDYFIPVLLPEDEYARLFKAVENKAGLAYIDKLNDDSIKIMDATGIIANNDLFYEKGTNLTYLIEHYALDTTFLTPFLKNYIKSKNFTTTFTLGTKYLDYALVCKAKIRPEIVVMAQLYLKQAKDLLEDSELKNKDAFFQKLKLYGIKQELVLDNAKKARRMLKRIKPEDVSVINENLFFFLNYTTFIVSKDEENAAVWRTKVTQRDLTKASLILKNSN